MTSYLKNLAVTTSADATVDEVYRLISQQSKSVSHPGIALVLDAHSRLIGIITDGDVRRAYASDFDFQTAVSNIMTKTPITLSIHDDQNDYVSLIREKTKRNDRFSTEMLRHIPVIDDSFRVVDIVDSLNLLFSNQPSSYSVSIYGMGYVGLTLAVALANIGHKVLGIDINESLVNSLTAGQPHIYEPGLKEMLKVNIAAKTISFAEASTEPSDIHIISVGTPITQQSSPDLSFIDSAIISIAKVLRKGDQVLLRSTVPLGTTRKHVVPLLEAKSNLSAGIDFFVSFAPERTVEGQALHELKTLPQVIGGLTNICTSKSMRFWSSLCDTIIQAQSIEAAELVKLSNNSFRDLSFAFANQIALLCHAHNINAFDAIRVANEGYPRNRISMPSPGVGGYCLTKDPILLSSSFSDRTIASLPQLGRSVNETAALYPLEVIDNYLVRTNGRLEDNSILIIGIAFKGDPETNDVRGSTSLQLAHVLADKCKTLKVWDAVIPTADLLKLGLDPVPSLNEGIKNADIVLILNNNRHNILAEALTEPSERKLIFDGWNQLNQREIERISGFTYSTMGYMTPYMS